MTEQHERDIDRLAATALGLAMVGRAPDHAALRALDADPDELAAARGRVLGMGVADTRTRQAAADLLSAAARTQTTHPSA